MTDEVGHFVYMVVERDYDMDSRMNRYDKRETRSDRNRELYERLTDTNSFSTYTDINNSNTVVLDATKKSYRTREGYQKIRDYTDVLGHDKVKKELDDFNNTYKETNKVYDINSVILEAKKNRINRDIDEEKRKLKDTSYNVFNLDNDKIEEYRKSRNKVIRADSDEFKEILNTITTKAINGEIDRETSVNLLSDLMATQAMDRVEGIHDDTVLNDTDLKLVNELKNESDINDKKLESNNQSKNIFKDMDQSFYTRSMDLSDKDFDTELVDDDNNKKSNIGIKIFFTIILLAIIGVLMYYIYKKYFI